MHRIWQRMFYYVLCRRSLSRVRYLLLFREVDKIMAYPIMSTPALVVDEVVKVSGRIPTKDELIAMLK